MASLDEAELTMFLALRPVIEDPMMSRPIAGLAIRFDPGPRLANRVLRGLLAQGWELVAAPVGHFEPARKIAMAAISCTGTSAITVTAAGELLYGAERLPPPFRSMLPPGWAELAEGTRNALVCVAVSPRPISTMEDIDTAARGGHLVGGYALVTMTSGWAAVWRPDLAEAGPVG